MADLSQSADADTSTNLDSSYTGSPLAKLSSRVGQLRVWQEQQRARLIRQQEETQRVFEEKQSELAALIGSPGSGGGSPARQAGGAQRLANSPATNSSSTAPADRHNSCSATETNTMSPQRQSEGPGAPAEHEDTPLRPVQFDTLLERELQRQTPPAPAAKTAAGPPAAKRPFLKRGTGLQRFGLRPGQQVRLRPGRGRAGRAAGRGGRIVLRSAPRGDGPWRPAPGRDRVADPADTLALLGDLRHPARRRPAG
ncbi:translation initiation factor IF-2-like [Amphibalanus amphitrite]|uniref:translation initiation factor IF-2-like n=1 Tax=Amphibalanus amphitrite TaxID=1232801 RepID=UPI001C90D75C|nr:translation initiation factor IF-2-like [Amphibalanus amphitrite]